MRRRNGSFGIALTTVLLAAPPLAAEVGRGCGDELVVSRAGNVERFTLYDVDPEAHAVRWLAEERSHRDGGAIATFGDVDGDGFDELGMVKTSGGNPHWGVFRYDGDARFETVITGGRWGAGHGGTAVAFGDVDGNGLDELAVGRHGPGMRFAVYGIIPVAGSSADPWEIAFVDDWGRGIFPTALAFGDMDGDGLEELAVGRSGGRNGRFLVYRFEGGRALDEVDRERSWGPGKRTTALAFGDVDGDGRKELAVGRDGDPGEPRLLLYRLVDGRLVQLDTVGEGWGPGFRATAIAFGDADGDGRDELAVGRNGDKFDERLFLLRWSGGRLQQLDGALLLWGDGRYPISLAFGDTDADGRHELAVARAGLERAHFGVMRLTGDGPDLRLGAPVMGGADWGSDEQATAVSFRGRRRDRDGDGLLDPWELFGIDGDCDGVVDLELDGADPRRKDLYVELDFMEHHRPLFGVEQAAREMFEVSPVPNRGHRNGVRLHLEIDEEVPHRDELPVFGENLRPSAPSFVSLKRRRFGTVEQRRSENARAILAAKRLAYRYSLWIHDLADLAGSGRAEPGGNDFVVSLGSFTVRRGHGVGDEREQVGTFVHELGHTLGLRHGGGDDVNCKPNYLSVMSYTFQFDGIPNPAYATGRLDYSRSRLPTLVEDDLDERAGIGAGSDLTRWGSEPPGVQSIGGAFLRTGDGSGPLDWDADGRIERRAAIDVNDLHMRDCLNSPHQTLQGHDDWANLDFDFRDSPYFDDGAHPSPEETPREPTSADARRLAACPAGTRCGHGDWKRWCASPPSGAAARTILACLRSTATFADVDSLAAACRQLSQAAGRCGESRAEMLRLALDLCTGTAASCCPVRRADRPPEPLADVFAELDRRFVDPVREIDECRNLTELARSAR